METVYLDLTAPHSDEASYGMALFEAYVPRFAGLLNLFNYGMSGLCCGEEAPLSTEDLFIIAHGIVSLPDFNEAGPPQLSESGKLECLIESSQPSSMPIGYRLVLRGLFTALVEDGTREGLGEIAIAACSTLAEAGYVPFPGSAETPPLLLRNVSMSSVGTDALIELTIDAHKRIKLADPALLMQEAGGLDLTQLKQLAESKR